MSDSEMTDLADQLNDFEVPLTAQSKAQRKRQEEVTSLLGTDMSGLAEQLMVADLAPDHVPSPKLLEMKRLDLNLPVSEHGELSQSMCFEEVRASLRAKDAKKRDYGRVGGSGRVTKLAIRGGPPGIVRSDNKVGSGGGTTKTKMVIRGGRPRKVEDDSKVHADRRATEAPREAYRKRLAPVEPSYNYNFDSQRLEYEAWLQRGGRSWSTEAVADFGRDEVDKYAFFR